MKQGHYAVIEAQIICCRLHHNNNLKYSVALKLGKEQTVSTDFKPHRDLRIEMDTKLTLHADKHSYDNFPKLTLIVNALGDEQERRAVGSTFANYKKEGVQVFQVSECSCKDKAFEVEVSFTTRVIEAKNSKIVASKNQQGRDSKNNFFSQQPTPRESREQRLERGNKQIRQKNKLQLGDIGARLKQVKSQKILKPLEQSDQDGGKIDYLKREIGIMNEKLLQQSVKLLQLQKMEETLNKLKNENEMLFELLQLQEEKTRESLSYISTLQLGNLCYPPKLTTSKSHIACATSFKVIEEKDEIIMVNEELLSELQKQKVKIAQLQAENRELRKIELENDKVAQLIAQNSQFKKQIQFIAQEQKTHRTELIAYKQQVSKREKTKEQQIQALKQALQNQIAEKTKIQSEFQTLKPVIQEQPILMMTSRLKTFTQPIVEQPDLYEQKIQQLKAQINALQQKFTTLKHQIEGLQLIKCNLEKDIVKIRSAPNPKKNSPVKPPQNKKEEQTRRSEKVYNSKDKNQKPPIKAGKKAVTASPSNIVVPTKKAFQQTQIKSQKNDSTQDKKTKLASTEVQSKTQRQESLQKSMQILSNDVKSEQNLQKFNQLTL